MSNILAHIIGLDEIHKKKLIKEIPKTITIIDLDAIQQYIYNHKNITEKKILWSSISQDININRKQKKLIGTNGINSSNIDKKIKKLLNQRKSVKQEIHQLWKQMMTENINRKIAKHQYNHLVFIGFNIYPKDYRVKVNLSTELSNNFYIDCTPKIYASNQIKYYINNFSDKIINGSFPLNLLKHDYLETRYDKFINYYINANYTGILIDKLLDKLLLLSSQIIDTNQLGGSVVYVATIYKSGDVIPVNSRTPIEGFLSRNDAIDNIKSKIKNNSSVYIYEIDSKQFKMIEGKLVAQHELYPINEESCLLTISP